MNISIRTKLLLGITIFSLFVSSVVAFFVFKNSKRILIENESISQSSQLENAKNIKDDFRNKMINSSMISFLVTLFFSMLASFFLINIYFIKPMNHLLFYTERIKEGDYNFKIKTNRNDEIGILANSLNEMTEKISESNTKLNQHAKDLEDRVQERTRELTDAKELAEALTKNKNEFLTYISHQIRTPMNSILAVINLLSLDQPKPEQIPKLEILKFSLENLMVIIDEILDFNKIEANKMKIEKKEFNLQHLIESMRGSIIPLTDEKKLEFIVEFDKRLPKQVIGDPVRLFQILNNLIQNAISFTNSGSIHLFLKLNSSTASNVKIDFSVVDTGMGIPENELSSIFDNFARNNKSPGSGLGLPITKKLLDLFDSQIFVESQINIGSNFSFSLDFELPTIEFTSPSIEKNDIDSSLSNLKLLLVEDYKLNQIVVEEFLNIWNISVDIADNGKMAVEMAGKKDYSIILMDLQMPVLDGYESAKLIRALPNDRYKTIPIIALTASAISETIAKAKNSGMNDYITKPFKPDELYKKIIQYAIPSQ